MVHSRWERAVVLVAQIVGTVALVALMLQVSINGVLRRLAGVQIPLTLELTEWWYMPLVAAAGIAIAAVQRAHFFVDLVYECLDASGKRVLAAIANLIALALTLAVTYFSLVQALDEAAVARFEPVSGLPIWPLTFVIPLAFAMFSVALIVNVHRLVIRRQGEEFEVAQRDNGSTEIAT